MGFPEYSDYDATGLADLVRNGEVTPAELVDEAIARIDKHNDTLNAVVHRAFEQARSAAASTLPSGPFRGVPFIAIKQLPNPICQCISPSDRQSSGCPISACLFDEH